MLGIEVCIFSDVAKEIEDIDLPESGEDTGTEAPSSETEEKPSTKVRRLFRLSAVGLGLPDKSIMSIDIAWPMDNAHLYRVLPLYSSDAHLKQPYVDKNQ